MVWVMEHRTMYLIPLSPLMLLDGLKFKLQKFHDLKIHIVYALKSCA